MYKSRFVPAVIHFAVNSPGS